MEVQKYEEKQEEQRSLLEGDSDEENEKKKENGIQFYLVFATRVHFCR